MFLAQLISWQPQAAAHSRCDVAHASRHIVPAVIIWNTLVQVGVGQISAFIWLLLLLVVQRLCLNLIVTMLSEAL
jgi:hypothetical protein